MRSTRCIAPIIAVAATAFSASAGIGLIHLDINGVSVNAGGPFAGTTHTGDLAISNDPSTAFIGASVGGNPVSPTGSIASLSALINLANGASTGGSFLIVLDQGETLNGVFSGGGSVSPQAGEGFTVDSLVLTATFSNLVGGTHFGGVNVGQFGTTFFGSFLLSAFDPDANGLDENANLEFFLDVPSPGPSALVGIAFLAAAPRRRR